MTQPLKILLAEDNPADAELLLRTLRQAGFEPDWHRVDTEAEYLAQLHAGLDLVLSDYEMPQFSGLRALELLRQSGLEVPFILVSGTIGEDTGVAAMKRGATDYLLKDRLTRLGPAVSHALEQSRLHRERRRAEEELRLFRSLVDQSNDSFEVVDPATARFLDINEKGLIDLGYTRAEYLSLRVSDIDPTVDPAAWPQLTDKIRTGGALRGEGIHRRKDGSTFPVEFNAKWVRLDRDYIVVVVRDISARKRDEAALHEGEERFRQVVENIREVFWMTDPAEGTMLYISPGYEAVWGRTCESLYRKPGNWVEAIHPDDRKRVLEAAAARQANGSYDETYRIVRPDGALRWVRDRAYPIRNAAGQVYRIVGTAEDISSHKEMETQVMRMQRMESVGRMASGIAHDLNNILAPVLMGVPLLRMGLSPEHVEKTLLAIETSARRGADLVRQLLMFGRGVEGRRMMVRVKDLVREMEEITGETFPRNIVIATGVPADAWPVMGDATQLHQVLLNLCVNARDAMPQGGSLTITAKNLRIDESYASMSPEARPGNYVCLAVTDTGTGIPAGVLDKIFDPFFTTKEVGKGTGLGLSTLVGIVKSHAGFVTVRSEVGRGSTFQVYLPAEPEMKEAPLKADSAEPPRGHGETILLVDDEPSIREVTGKILERFGYRVLSCGDGADACAQFARHLAEIEIVLTDIDMPVMGGVEMLQVLKRMKPAVKVIVSSGKASELGGRTSRAELTSLQVNAILTKPYTAERILHVIHDVIANAPRQSGPGDTLNPFHG